MKKKQKRSVPHRSRGSHLSREVDQAAELGLKAFKAGEKRIPALDTNLKSLLFGKTASEGAPITKAWLNAWDVGNLARRGNPVRIHRLKSGRFRVRSGKRVTAAATTHLRAIRQASLIRGVRSGRWKPTGKPARSVRKKVASLKGSNTLAFRKKGRWTIMRGSMKAGKFRVLKKGLTEGQVRQWAKTNGHRIRAM